jgi:hypothetical protein
VDVVISNFEKLSGINTHNKMFSDVIMELSLKWNTYDKDKQDEIVKEILNTID